jgi:hypothetical protein
MGQRGRTLYRKKYLPIIVSMADEKKADVEIARSLGIGRSTLRDWYKAHPELATAVEDAREIVVRTDVEAALYKRAHGFTAQERIIEVDPKNPSDPTKFLSVKVKERYFPPSVTAINIILTNKLPTEYKNRQSIEHSGKLGIKTYIGFTPDDWDEQFPDGQPMRNVTGAVGQLEATEKAGDTE